MSSYVQRATNVTTASTPWHIGLTPSFPSSILLSDNVAIESLLSDIPFLAIGLLAFAALTFLLVVRRFDVRTIPLFLSALFAFLAIVLDVDQLLVQNSPATPNTPATVLLSSVLPLLIAREVFLAIAVGMRFLYFWVYLTYLSGRDSMGSGKSTTKLNNKLNPEEPNFLRLDNDKSLFRTSYPNSKSRGLKWSLIPFPSLLLSLFFRYTLLAATLLVPIFQLLWRLVKEFNRHGRVYVAESVIEIIVSVVFMATLSLGVWFAEVDKSSPASSQSGLDMAKINGNDNHFIDRLDSSWKKQEKWKALRRHIPVLISVLVGLGIGIGNLICFEFSESSLGRLLQALELYILILTVLISTFHKPKSKASRSSMKSDRLLIGKDKDGFTAVDEKTPASRSSFNLQPRTGSLLPTSVPSPNPRRSLRLSSWLASINTNRDDDVNDTGMPNTPGSSILSPSPLNPKANGRVPSFLSNYLGRARSFKSRSGLLNGTGGRIRSVSWDMFNPALEGGTVEKRNENGTTVNSSNESYEKHTQRPENHPYQLQASASVIPSSRMPTPPLASRLERLAMQLDSMPSALTGGQTNDVRATASSFGRISVSVPMSNSNEFRLTPLTHNALQLDRLSHYYEPDTESNYLDPATYSLRYSESYTKSIRSSRSNSSVGFETFLNQQQAELNKSVAELRLFEGGLVDNRDGGENLSRSQKDSLASDFSFSRFPEPPTALGQDTRIGSNTFAGGTEVGASRASLETVTPINNTSASSLQGPLTFPSPVKRSSGDSSVLGVNEGALTLGLGLGIGGIVNRDRPGTSSQFDVTSFIASGGGRIDSSQSYLYSPFPQDEQSRPSSSDVEDADGTSTPTRSVVRFATLVRVPPMVSVASERKTPLRFPLQSRRETALNAADEVDVALTSNTSQVAPFSTTLLTTTTGPEVARPEQTPTSNINHIPRRKIGLPSSVKLNIGNSTPNPFVPDLKDVVRETQNRSYQY